MKKLIFILLLGLAATAQAARYHYDFSTYFDVDSGGGNDINSVITDSAGNIYLAGHANYSISRFPNAIKIGPAGSTDSDTFVAKLSPDGSLQWISFVGGSQGEFTYTDSLTLGPSGKIYVSGMTYSSDFPKVNALPSQAPITGEGYIFILSPNGETLEYSTTFGGSKMSDIFSIEVNQSGEIYVGGSTLSTDLPAAVNTEAVDGFKGFISKISADGQTVLYSRYIAGIDQGPGDHSEIVRELFLDNNGNPYFVASVSRPGIETTPGSFSSNQIGETDLYLAQLDGQGALLKATYFGGSGDEFYMDAAMNGDGHIWVGGETRSANFPSITGSVNQYSHFLVRFDENLNPVATFDNKDMIRAIQVDADDNLWVTGETSDVSFPVTETPLQAENQGLQDAYLHLYSPTANLRIYSTYLGGSEYDLGIGLATDPVGSLIIAGISSSLNFPLTNPLQTKLLNNYANTVTKITSDGWAKIELKAANYTVTEGAGPVNFTVKTLMYFENKSVSVEVVTEDITAIANQHYTPFNQTMTWNGGFSHENGRNIPITNNSIWESNRTFKIKLQNPVGGYLGPISEAIVTIVEDDVNNPGTIAFKSATYDLVENQGTVLIEVERTGGSDGEIIYSFGHYLPPLPIRTTLVEADLADRRWADGEMGVRTIRFYVGDNNTYEGNETHRFDLRVEVGNAAVGLNETHVNIIDDEVPPNPGIIAFKSATYDLHENVGFVIVEVERTGGSAGEVSASWDHLTGQVPSRNVLVQALPALRWLDGETGIRQLRVTLDNDTVFNGDETHRITLTGLLGGVTAGTIDRTDIHLIDDETGTPGQIVFRDSVLEVSENVGRAHVILDRIGGADGYLTFSWITTDLTAVRNVDYLTPNGFQQMVWNPGETSKTLSFDIINDAVFKGPREFRVEIINKHNGPVTVWDPSYFNTVRILEDDLPQRSGDVGFPGINSEFSEGDGTIQIPVERNGTAGQITLTYRLSQGGPNEADPANDFTLPATTLDFEDGETLRHISIQLHDDGIVESDEWIHILLTDVTGDGEVGSIDLHSIKIKDNDIPSGMRVPSYTGRVGELIEMELEIPVKPPYYDELFFRWEVIWSGLPPARPPFTMITYDRQNASTVFYEPGEYHLVVRLEHPNRWVAEVPFTVTIEAPPPALAALPPSRNIFDLSQGQTGEISYQLTTPGQIRITIYDRIGQEIVKLLDTDQSAGNHAREWDGRDASGSTVASGVYTALIEENGSTRRLKIIVYK